MSKKVAIIDEDLPRVIDQVLEELSWEVKDVRDIGLKGTDDEEIISFAKKSKAVLFSGDWGFANILMYPPNEYYGIVILSFPNEASSNFIAKESRQALSQISFETFKGSLIIIESGRIRIRQGKQRK